MSSVKSIYDMTDEEFDEYLEEQYPGVMKMIDKIIEEGKKKEEE